MFLMMLFLTMPPIIFKVFDYTPLQFCLYIQIIFHIILFILNSQENFMMLSLIIYYPKMALNIHQIIFIFFCFIFR